MTDLVGRTAVVTGAASGIGRALALELAGRGASVAVSDIDPDGLAATTAELTARGASVHSAVLDVRDKAAWELYAKDVLSELFVVHQLYNVAGIAAVSPLTDISDETFAEVVDTNLWGTVHGTKTFLPHLIESGRGVVVNIASIEAMMGYSGLTAYCASKFAVRGFTEALQVEMLAKQLPVSVHAVLPGSVRTDIFVRAGGTGPAPDADRRVTPEAAARTIADGVGHGRRRILIARDTHLVDRLVRLLPTGYLRIIARTQRAPRR